MTNYLICIRVQKSVFFAPRFSPSELRNLKNKIDTLTIKGQSKSDSILCISIDKQDFRKMIWLENENSLSHEIKERQSKLF